jgi:hypothetical protein
MNQKPDRGPNDHDRVKQTKRARDATVSGVPAKSWRVVRDQRSQTDLNRESCLLLYGRLETGGEQRFDGGVDVDSLARYFQGLGFLVGIDGRDAADFL